MRYREGRDTGEDTELLKPLRRCLTSAVYRAPIGKEGPRPVNLLHVLGGTDGWRSSRNLLRLTLIQRRLGQVLFVNNSFPPSKDNLSIHFYECAFTFIPVDDRFIFVCITCTGSGYGSFKRVPLSVQNKQNMFRIVGKMHAE